MVSLNELTPLEILEIQQFKLIFDYIPNVVVWQLIFDFDICGYLCFLML